MYIYIYAHLHHGPICSRYESQHLHKIAANVLVLDFVP